MRPLDVPVLPLAVRGQDEGALPRSGQDSYSTHARPTFLAARLARRRVAPASDIPSPPAQGSSDPPSIACLFAPNMIPTPVARNCSVPERVAGEPGSQADIIAVAEAGEAEVDWLM